MQDLIQQLNEKWEKAISAFENDLSKVRTGRANPSMLDIIKIDYYGTPTPIAQMATVSAPDAKTLVVQPWDQSALEMIEKSIQTSNLGFTPQNDGKIIRIPIPALTEERRKEFVKLVGKHAEDAKIAVRNIRRNGMDELKKAEKDKEISEDEHKRFQGDIQDKTDHNIKKIDDLADVKSKEILAI